MTPKGHFETNWPLVTFVFDYRLSLVGTYLECQICCWYLKERFCGHERSTEKRIGNMGQLNSLVVFSDAICSRQISLNFVGSPPHCIKTHKKSFWKRYLQHQPPTVLLHREFITPLGSLWSTIIFKSNVGIKCATEGNLNRTVLINLCLASKHFSWWNMGFEHLVILSLKLAKSQSIFAFVPFSLKWTKLCAKYFWMIKFTTTYVFLT